MKMIVIYSPTLVPQNTFYFLTTLLLWLYRWSIQSLHHVGPDEITLG